MSYIRKSQPVEAFRLTHIEVNLPYPAWFIAAMRRGHIKPDGDGVSVKYVDGFVRCNPGDWIVCKAGCGPLDSTYEVVSNDAFLEVFEPLPVSGIISEVRAA